MDDRRRNERPTFYRFIKYAASAVPILSGRLCRRFASPFYAHTHRYPIELLLLSGWPKCAGMFWKFSPRKKVRIKVGVNKLVAGVDVERGRVKCVHPVLINEVAVWYDVWFSWIRRAPGASRSYAPRCTFWQTTPHVSINDMMIHVLEFSNLSVLKLSFSL